MDLIVFDMDGVLFDPTDSFRQGVIEIVRRLTGRETTHARITEIKHEGGYNDDADVALRIAREFGFETSREEIVALGERLFWGANGDGLILRERRLFADGLLERFASRAQLAIFTGRDGAAARFSLERFCPDIDFDPIVTSDGLENLKPAPDGLLRAIERHPGRRPVYFGDTVDDARAARAAGVPFVGVAAADAPMRAETVKRLLAEGAFEIIESVNDAERLLR